MVISIIAHSLVLVIFNINYNEISCATLAVYMFNHHMLLLINTKKSQQLNYLIYRFCVRVWFTESQFTWMLSRTINSSKRALSAHEWTCNQRHTISGWWIEMWSLMTGYYSLVDHCYTYSFNFVLCVFTGNESIYIRRFSKIVSG